MLPLTSSNFNFFYKKWTKKLNEIDDNNEKNIYAKKITDKLWNFGNSNANNVLVPYVKNWCDKVGHENVSADILIKGLNQLAKDNDKLTL